MGNWVRNQFLHYAYLSVIGMISNKNFDVNAGVTFRLAHYSTIHNYSI